MITLLIDMDGVLTRDKELNPFPYASEFVRNLKSKGIPFRIVSNNSTRSPKEIVNTLREKGVPLDYGDLITPVALLPDFLRGEGVSKVFVIGTGMLRRFLEESGFEVREDFEVDAVVVGQDRELDFRKLKTATSAVFLRGAKIVPVNLSRIVKDSDGLYFPGAGAVALSLVHATGYRRELPNLGKPSPKFIELALRGLPSDYVFLVSDDIYTDLIGAKELGVRTVFMTTGKYGVEELKRAGFAPDFTLGGLRELENKIFEWSKS